MTRSTFKTVSITLRRHCRKNLDHAVGIHWSYSLYISQIINGHGFLISNYARASAKLQEGTLCPLLRVPQ